MQYKIILRFIKQNKRSYAAGMVFVFFASFVQSLFPKILGDTIDILKVEGFDAAQVKAKILLLLAIGIVTFASTSIWRNLIIGNGRKLECHLRELLFSHLQQLSPEFYTKRKTGDLIAYATNDVSAVRMAFGPATALAFNGIVICLASMYTMLQTTGVLLTAMALLPIPLIIFFMLKIGKLVHQKFRRVQENFAAISDRIQENIYGIRVIKAYAQENAELENFELLNEAMYDSNLSMVKISSLMSPVIEASFSISFVMNLIVGSSMVLNGSMTLGSFIAFNTYLVLIMKPILSIGRIINIYQRGTASLKRLNEIFEVTPAVKDGPAMLSTPIKGNVELRKLDFSYPGTNTFVLKGIELTIPTGHTLGIIGRTGSGKSTLANLLLKLYNVEQGKILIDGNDLMDYSLETLRTSIGYIPQDYFLFSASLQDNITFFNNNFTEAQIEAAAKHSCIYDTITALPEGFLSMLGDRGINLSGGQKQRVAIARCLIRNPEILIIDDALSAVDSITERQILHHLKMLRKEKTTILIAHKISTVMHADQIIVLESGAIAERGTHEQLLAERGLYYDIFHEQIKDRESDAAHEAS